MSKIKIHNVEIDTEELEALGWTKPRSKPNTRRKPQINEEYYWIAGDGLVNKRISYSTFRDKKYFTLDNAYNTSIEALAALDRQLAEVRVIDRLRELEDGWEVNWIDSNQHKFVPDYCFILENLDVSLFTTTLLTRQEWVSSEEVWSKVIKEMPDDVKLMMGIDK